MTFTLPGRGTGIVQVASPEERNEQDRREFDQRQDSLLISSLASYINQHFQNARDAKTQIEQDMIESLRQRRGEYDPAKLADIRNMGGSEIYMMLTSIKCRAAEAWIQDILIQPGDKTWAVKPTPVPEMPPHIEKMIGEQVAAESQQMNMMGAPVDPAAMRERFENIKDELMRRLKDDADKRADRMEKKIEDQLVEAGWDVEFRAFIKDVVTFKAGIMKCPVFRKDRKFRWMKNGRQWAPRIEERATLKVYRVSPFDIYPSPTARDVQDSYIIERHRLRRKDLLAMKGVPGYDDEAIDAVIEQFGLSGLREWMTTDFQRAELENRHRDWIGNDETIDAAEYTGSIPGRLLRDWGMSEREVPEEEQEYAANVWVIGPYVIRAVLNEDPLGRKPYFKASFEEIPGAFWGVGVPELMRDVQDVANAAARSLVNNLAIASGPQIEVSTDRLAPGEELSTLVPWRIWQTESDPSKTSHQPAIQFYQPNSYADALMKVYDYFARLADEYTGIPAYTYGNPDVSGAGDTASGLSMLMTAAARGIKQVVHHIDRCVEGAVERLFEHNMLYDPDESIKGDARIQAIGSQSLIAKEQQQVRRTEFLQMTANPIDMQIIGLPGRAALLREAVKSLDIPIDDVVPDPEKLKAEMRNAAQQQMAQQQAGGAPPPQEKTTTNMAGQPAGGVDTALFSRG